MPEFPDSLFSISNLCNAGLHCTFTPTDMKAFNPKTKAVKLQEWRDTTLKLQHFPIYDILHKQAPPKQKLFHQVLLANNAYDLSSSAALVKYYYATPSYLEKETQYQAIKKGNYATQPCLTIELARRYYSNAEETTLGTMSAE